MRRTCFAVLVSSVLAVPNASHAQQTRFTDIAWHYIDSYGTFMRTTNTFVYDDPATWRFVAFSNLPAEGEDPLARMFMKFDGALREFNRTQTAEDGDAMVLYYETAVEPVIKVTMRLVKGTKGSESTAYTGTLTEKSSGASVDFTGDCGV